MSLLGRTPLNKRQVRNVAGGRQLEVRNRARGRQLEVRKENAPQPDIDTRLQQLIDALSVEKRDKAFPRHKKAPYA